MRVGTGERSPAEHGFAAAFVRVRSVTLEQRAGGRVLAVGELVSTPSGHFWLVDPRAGDVKIYGLGGRLLHVLRGGSRLADLCAPVSLAHVHGSWVAVLDAGAGRVVLYDGRARRQGGFDLPQVEAPFQLRNLGDEHLAVVGPGGGRRPDRLVHLYRFDGRYAESVFSVSRRAVRETRDTASRDPTFEPPHATAQSAAVGRSILLAYAPARSVTRYDFATRMVHSFPLDPGADSTGGAAALHGLFAGPGGRVVVMQRTWEPVERYVYALYDASGEVVLGNVHSSQRVVGVEGRLFYSIRTSQADGGFTLQICRLRHRV